MCNSTGFRPNISITQIIVFCPTIKEADRYNEDHASIKEEAEDNSDERRLSTPDQYFYILFQRKQETAISEVSVLRYLMIVFLFFFAFLLLLILKL